MKTIIKLILFSAYIFVQKGNAQSYQISEKNINDINHLIEDLSAKDQFSGTVLISKGNQIIYKKAVGYANKAQNSLNNIDTKFNMASMNKMFTAVAIAQLAEKNHLKFTDKVVKYLPLLPTKTFGEITIDQLLNHTSGAPDFFRIPEFMAIKDTSKTINTYVNLGINEPLLFKPGVMFQYSNYGYILLGAVIEKVSNMSYFDYMKKNIFLPAGMENTDSYETDKPNSNLAIGYALPPPMPGQRPKPMDAKVIREPNTSFIEVKGTSAGGGYSTVIDLHKFSTALLSGKLISTKSVENITDGKIIMPAQPMPPNTKQMPIIKYGFGFGEFYKNNTRIIGHNGGAPGVSVQMDIYPDLGYTVIVLSNIDFAVMPIINLTEEIITKN